MLAIHLMRKRNIILQIISKESNVTKSQDPEIDYNLGNVLKNIGDNHNAAKYFKSALKLYPNYPQANNNLGVILQQ